MQGIFSFMKKDSDAVKILTVLGIKIQNVK